MKIYTSLIFLFFSIALTAQSDYSLLFQKYLPQANINANPGIFSDHKINISLPNVSGEFMNSGFQFNDAIVETAGGNDLDFEKALRKMKNKGNFARASFSASAFAINFRIKENYQFSFFHNTVMDFQVKYPKTLPALLWRGNGAFVGQEVEIAPNINGLGYSEYGFGFATKANDKMTIGFNAKYVNGFLGVQTHKASTVLHTGEEFYQLTFVNDVELRTAGLTDIFDSEEENSFATTDPAYFMTGGSRGFSVDLGMDYQVNDKLNIQVAVQDFGSISWSQHVLQQTSKGTFEYNGEIVRPFGNENDEFDFKQVRDSISDLFEFSAKPKTFLSNLPLHAYAAAAYQLDPTLTIGGSLHVEQFADMEVTNITVALHGQKQFGNVFYLGGIMGYNSSIPFFGVNTTLQLGPAQLFFITDNVITLIDPTIGRLTNMRAGLNLSFLRKKLKVDTPEIEAGLAPQ